MPYVTPDKRRILDPLLKPLAEKITSRGELNYAITALVASQVNQVGYASVEAAVGVLECAKLEFYRRVAGPYEDIKLQENGDVYFSEVPNGGGVVDPVMADGPMPTTGKSAKRAKDPRLGGTSATAP